MAPRKSQQRKGWSPIKTTVIALILVPGFVFLSMSSESHLPESSEKRKLGIQIEEVEMNSEENHDQDYFVDETERITRQSKHFEEAIGSSPVDGTWRLDCPAVPPHGYPAAYPVMDLINNWSPDLPTPIPEQHYTSYCRFDYKKDLNKALAYRDAELPFVMFNVPKADKVVERWKQPDYLEKMAGTTKYRADTSHNNHFMYHNTPRGSTATGKKAWRKPTGVEQMNFAQFKKKALACEARYVSQFAIMLI